MGDSTTKLEDCAYTSARDSEKDIITGFGLSRQVFFNDEPLDPVRANEIVHHSPDGFNWGYGGSGPALLAYAIVSKAMEKHFPKQQAEQRAVTIYQKFKSLVISLLPQTNFKIRLHVLDFQEFELEARLYNPLTRVEMEIGGMYVPLLLCFNVHRFKTALITQHALEHYYLKQLTVDQLEILNAYLKKSTKRYDVMKKEDVWMEVKFGGGETLEDTYTITGGDGEGVFYGHAYVNDDMALAKIIKLPEHEA